METFKEGLDLKTTEMETKRNSTTEVLRIVAMLMIVISHYSVHGVIDYSKVDNPVNFLFLNMMTLGNIGVHIFILLFGYYSVSHEKIKWRRAFLLWAQVFTYSVLIFAFSFISGQSNLSIGDIFRSIFPTIFSKYWFFTTYIVFFMLTPFVNKLLQNLSQKQYMALLGALLIFWSIIPTFTKQLLSGSDFTLFLTLYTLGGYFKLYPQNILNSKKCGFLMTVISSFLLFGSSVIFFMLKKIHPVFDGRETFFYHKNSVLTIFFALGLLLVAINGKRRYNKVVNWTATCTFGVYLLHDNDLIRSMIWEKLFRISNFINSPFLIGHCMLTVIIVFILGIVIESVRKITLEKLEIICIEWFAKKTRKLKLRK